MYRGRRLLLLAAGFGISGLFLWLAVRNAQFTDFRQVLSGTELWMLVPFTASLLLFYWIRTWRWKLLLSPISGVAARSLFGPVMIGYGANFLMPFQMGEIARSLAARGRTGLPFVSLAFSIVIERLFDLLVILVALTLSLLTHTALPDYVGRLGIVVAAGIVLVMLATAALALRTEQTIAVIGRMIAFLPDRLRQGILSQLRLGANGLHSLRSGRVLIGATLVSILQWGVLMSCIWLSLIAVGTSASIPTLLLILSLVVLGGSIPNAPGYVGSIQAGYVLAVETAGGDSATGLAASVVFHAMYALTAIGMGAAALWRSDIDLRMVRSAAPGAEGGGSTRA